MKFRSGIWIALLLSACHGGGRLDETYSYRGTDHGAFGRPETMEIRFKPDGTAVVTEGGEKNEVKYEVDGSDIKLVTPAGTKIFTRKPGDVLESGRIRLVRGGLEEAVKRNPVAPTTTSASSPASPLPSTADKSLPLEKYVLLDGTDKNRDFAYLYYALGGKPDTPDEDLKVLSSEYFNERDVFKKKEIAERERPRIEQEKERHRASMRYFAIKLESFGIASLRPYDFEKKGFVLPGTACSQSSIRMDSGVVLVLRPAEPHCFLRVADDDQARKLEALRAKVGAYVEVTFYGYAEGVSSGALDVTSIAMGFHIREGREVPGRGPGESVAEFRLRL